MKFVVSASGLLKHLQVVSGVITNNPVVPILENFLFEVNGEQLKITASDLQTSMITETTVETNEEGSIAVPARILMDTLKNLPEQPIVFSVDQETYSITVSSDNGHYKLAGENATDFPRVPEVENGFSVDMSTDILSRALNSTLFATSSDEVKPAMTGVYMVLTDTNTTFVATDGHRLVRYRRVDVASEHDNAIIVPYKALNLVRSTLPSESTNVQVEFNTANAFFSFGNTQLVCRLIDEKYPDYENVIPQENPNKLTIDRATFQSCLRRISIYANKTTHQIRIKISGSELQVSAEDLDFSNEANERLSCEYEGEDMEIGFNAKFLLEVINHIDSEKINMHLSAPNKGGLLTPIESDENEDILMLVMPVMLSNTSE